MDYKKLDGNEYNCMQQGMKIVGLISSSFNLRLKVPSLTFFDAAIAAVKGTPTLNCFLKLLI
jgi:hypothetical protein